jgi:oxygen-independent coproporphyrinogen-3 oxidase
MRDGLSLDAVQNKFGSTYHSHLLDKVNTSLNNGRAVLHDETIQLTNAGKLFADAIAADLFYE